MALRTLSLCTGGGGLDLGVRLASRVLGFDHRTVCYSEIEAYAAEVLVARIKDGLLDDAPVWSDLKTFDPAPWRGKVDLITGGYPCQPWSHAGRRRGVDDPRHLWPYIAGIVRIIQPRLCFFENVDGHLSLGFREVRGELEEMGYRVEAGVFSAEEAAAPHLRKRLFVLAHRDIELHDGRRYAGSRRRGESPDDSGVVEHAADCEQQLDRIPEGAPPVKIGGSSGRLGNPPLNRRTARRSVSEGQQGRPGSPGAGGTMAVPADPIRRPLGPAGNSGRQGLDPGRQGPGGAGEPGAVVYPPGPDDHDAWLNLLAERGDLAPALPNLGARGFAEVLEAEPEIRRALDGVAGELDDAFECRTERLQMLGNGVVPIAAGLAFCVLARRAGLVE